MKFIIDNWYLLLVALASGALLLWPVLKSASGGSLTPARAVQLINREKAVVIDVCEKEEFAAGHLVGAKNVPLGQLEERLPATVKNKALPLVIVCARAPALTARLRLPKSSAMTMPKPWPVASKHGVKPVCR